MRTSIKIAPPNSLVFVSDRNGGTAPQITRGARMWSTSSCVAVGCLAFMDGETELTLGNANEVDPGVRAAFDGNLETPNRTVVVSTVERKEVLSAKVPSVMTRVRIWVNHANEPDKVTIGIG